MRWCRLVGGVLAASLIGCARPGEREAEKAIVRLLPSYLGPARAYSVNVKGKSLGAIVRGRLREVHIMGDGVQLTEELTVRRLTVDADQVATDLKARTLQGVSQARFTAQIEERSLDSMARRRRPKLLDLKLRLTGRQVEVTVRPEVFGHPTIPITVLGSLTPRSGGTALDFEPDRGRLAIVPIPQALLDFVAERLNPVVDLSGLSVPIRVERADVEAGALTLTGSIPPDRLARWRPQVR